MEFRVELWCFLKWNFQFSQECQFTSELKYDKAVDTAIEQINRRQYPAKVAQYADDLLLVGITYELDTKLHWCCIERGMVW